MIALQSTIASFKMFDKCKEDEIINAIKNSTRKEVVIVKAHEGFLKYEGKRGSCEACPVDVKILVKKPPQERTTPKLTQEEEMMIFKEWMEANRRVPNPDETYNNLNIDKFYRKYYKNKQWVEQINSLLG